MTTPTMVVAGAGALGSLLAVRLLEAGCRPILVTRTLETAMALSETGIRIGSPGCPARTIRVPVTHQWDGVPNPRWVFATVKTYDLATLLEQARPALGRESTLVLLQNGLTAADTARAILPDVEILAAATQLAATRQDRGVIWEAALGPTQFGAVETAHGGRAEEAAQLFRRAGLPAEAVADVWQALWEKAVVNAAINPLGAIMGWRNGRLADHPLVRRLLLEAAEEASWAAAAAGHPVTDAGARALRVARATEDNLNSMRQDVEAGRPTEVLAITGRIVEVGEAHGLNLSVNRRLRDLVVSLAPVAPRRQRTSRIFPG